MAEEILYLFLLNNVPPLLKHIGIQAVIEWKQKRKRNRFNYLVSKIITNMFEGMGYVSDKVNGYMPIPEKKKQFLEECISQLKRISDVERGYLELYESTEFEIGLTMMKAQVWDAYEERRILSKEYYERLLDNFKGIRGLKIEIKESKHIEVRVNKDELVQSNDFTDIDMKNPRDLEYLAKIIKIKKDHYESKQLIESIFEKPNPIPKRKKKQKSKRKTKRKSKAIYKVIYKTRKKRKKKKNKPRKTRKDY